MDNNDGKNMNDGEGNEWDSISHILWTECYSHFIMKTDTISSSAVITFLSWSKIILMTFQLIYCLELVILLSPLEMKVLWLSKKQQNKMDLTSKDTPECAPDASVEDHDITELSYQPTKESFTASKQIASELSSRATPKYTSEYVNSICVSYHGCP